MSPAFPLVVTIRSTRLCVSRYLISERLYLQRQVWGTGLLNSLRSRPILGKKTKTMKSALREVDFNPKAVCILLLSWSERVTVWRQVPKTGRLTGVSGASSPPADSIGMRARPRRIERKILRKTLFCCFAFIFLFLLSSGGGAEGHAQPSSAPGQSARGGIMLMDAVKSTLENQPGIRDTGKVRQPLVKARCGRQRANSTGWSTREYKQQLYRNALAQPGNSRHQQYQVLNQEIAFAEFEAGFI